MTSKCAADTSVVVPALVRSHDAHETARAIMAERPALPSQVAVESYSVLTRLPVPMRVRAAVAADVLGRAFPDVIALDEDTQRDLVRTLAAAGIVGGSVYDAIVGLTVRTAGVPLWTRDRRARPTYAALGVDVRWLE
ncbi:MAG: PIN domain-containing protein [Mycobacteriales bacterium]